MTQTWITYKIHLVITSLTKFCKLYFLLLMVQIVALEKFTQLEKRGFFGKLAPQHKTSLYNLFKSSKTEKF